MEYCVSTIDFENRIGNLGAFEKEFLLNVCRNNNVECIDNGDSFFLFSKPNKENLIKKIKWSTI